MPGWTAECSAGERTTPPETSPGTLWLPVGTEEERVWITSMTGENAFNPRTLQRSRPNEGPPFSGPWSGVGLHRAPFPGS